VVAVLLEKADECIGRGAGLSRAESGQHIGRPRLHGL
jgi:hypothetical protein